MRVDYLKWDPSGRFLADAIQQPIVGAYYKYTYNNGTRTITHCTHREKEDEGLGLRGSYRRYGVLRRRRVN